MQRGRAAMEESPGESPAPEALGRMLVSLERRLGVDSMDRIWVFPPLIRGRKEWGLVTVSCLADDPSRRILVTGRYTAELTGSGVVFEHEILSEGSAPPDRLPHVMDGVVRRSDLRLGLPKETFIGGEPGNFRELLADYGWTGPPVDGDPNDSGNHG